MGKIPKSDTRKSGLPVVNLSVATDEAYRDNEGKRQERVEWHRVVVVGKLALTCHEYLRKGRQVFVEDRLRTPEWETNGAVGRRTEILASSVQFLGSPRSARIEIEDAGDCGSNVDTDSGV